MWAEERKYVHNAKKVIDIDIIYAIEVVLFNEVFIVVGSAKKKCPMCKIHFVAKFSPQKEGTIGKGRKLCHICTTKVSPFLI